MNSDNDGGGDDDDEHVDISDDCGHNIIVGFYVLFNFQSFIIPADHAMLLFDTYVLKFIMSECIFLLIYHQYRGWKAVEAISNSPFRVNI